MQRGPGDFLLRPAAWLALAVMLFNDIVLKSRWPGWWSGKLSDFAICFLLPVLLVAAWERRRDGFDTNDPAEKVGPGSGLYKTTDGGKTFRKINIREVKSVAKMKFRYIKCDFRWNVNGFNGNFQFMHGVIKDSTVYRHSHRNSGKFDRNRNKNQLIV